MSEHGTITQYFNHDCRCDECRKVGAEYARDARARRADLSVPTHLHGKNSTYVNYVCRCQPCKDAHAAYQRQYWRAQK